MARRARRSRPWLRRVLIVLGLLLAGAFLFFRPILFLPPQITRRVPLDYVPPYPSQIDFPFDDYTSFVPEKLAVPAEHWGKRATVLEKVIHEEDVYATDRFGDPVTPPEYVGKTYHGDRLTRVTSFRCPRARPPGDDSYAPWRNPILYMGSWKLTQRLWRMPLAERFWITVRWLMVTSRELPRWLYAACTLWRLEPTGLTSYHYDESGRLIAQWEQDLVWLEKRFGDIVLDRPETWGTRRVYDENGRRIGEMSFRDGKFTRGRIEIKDVSAGAEDSYWLRLSDGRPIVDWSQSPLTSEGRRRGCPSWSARYDDTGHLCADEEGIAGTVVFRQWTRDMNTHVWFDIYGRIADDEDGVAIERTLWESHEEWYVTARYDSDGRLARGRQGDAVELYRYSSLWPWYTYSTYRPNKMISSLCFEPRLPNSFGKAETLKLAAVLCAVLSCGCAMFGVLDWAFARRST